MLVSNDPAFVPTRAEETCSRSHRAYCPATRKIEWFRNRTLFRVFLWLTLRPDIAHLQPNAYRIEERFGNQRRFDFEFRVRYGDGSDELLAMRRSCDLVPEREHGMVPPHWLRARQHCERQGMKRGFLTEDALAPHEQRIDNWARILPYLQFATQVPDPELSEEIIDRFKRHNVLTLAELAAAFSSHRPQEVFAQTFHHLWTNRPLDNLDDDELNVATPLTVDPNYAALKSVPRSGMAVEQDVIPILEDPHTWLPFTAESIKDPVRRVAYERRRGIFWDRLVRGLAVLK